MPKPPSASQPELSTRGFASHDLRRILKLNDTLRKTRSLVAQSEQAAGSIALLLAETRVLVLRMGRYEFGQLAGMHFHAVKLAWSPTSRRSASLERT